MYLRINYEKAGDKYFAPDMFIFAASFLPKGGTYDREAVALDGLRIVFQTLDEASKRVEEKLLQLSTKRSANGFQTLPENSVLTEDKRIIIKEAKSPASSIDPLQLEQQMLYASLMADVWILVDNIRRIPLLLKFIPGIPSTITGGNFALIVDRIKHLRDSLHHIDERVKQYFDKVGESILGDLIWRYRSAPGKVEHLVGLVSGVTRGPSQINHLGQPQLECFLERLGVYDLRIRYVKRPRAADGKTYEDHKLDEVNLEEAIVAVNRIISFLADKYSKYYDQVQLEKKSVSGSPPFIITLRLKQEAWDAKNPPVNPLE